MDIPITNKQKIENNERIIVYRRACDIQIYVETKSDRLWKGESRSNNYVFETKWGGWGIVSFICLLHLLNEEKIKM
jgi:hypothetical protein